MEAQKEFPIRVYVGDMDIGSYLTLPASDLILLDTCTIHTAILPRKKRKVTNYMKLLKTAYGKSKPVQQKKSHTEFYKKSIEIVNAIEDGSFNKLGLVPAITGNVFSELRRFERITGSDGVKSLTRKGKKVCNVFMSLKNYRKKYPAISSKLTENGDFSLAVATIELGCGGIASDDYKDFDMPTFNRIKKLQYERWNTIPQRHDTDSVLLKLRSA